MSTSGQGLDDEDRALLEKVRAGFETVGKLYNACKAPWFQSGEDRQAAAKSMCVILRVVDSLRTILAPILPHTAQKPHEFLGQDGQLFGTQHAVEYQEETSSHQTLTYEHSGAIGNTLAALSAGPGKE